MIYAMSDIHGCLAKLTEKMKPVDLSGDNKLLFLGDYIDYGPESCQVLHFIYELQQKHGAEKVIALKGNHEAMLLEFIDDYYPTLSERDDECYVFNDWLRTDFEHGGNTIRTFITDYQMGFLDKISRTSSLETISKEAVRMLLSNNEELIAWVRKMPSFYETENQIFVHAGVDEEAGEYWQWGTSDDILLWKFPASKGEFYKTIIAGHVGTGDVSRDRSFHDVYFDGASHYYIDGSVYKHRGKLLLLGYDEKEDKYYQVEDDRMIPVRKYEQYR